MDLILTTTFYAQKNNVMQQVFFYNYKIFIAFGFRKVMKMKS
jgi:hypothetical protein